MSLELDELNLLGDHDTPAFGRQAGEVDRETVCMPRPHLQRALGRVSRPQLDGLRVDLHEKYDV